jgi:hypothetical protein
MIRQIVPVPRNFGDEFRILLNPITDEEERGMHFRFPQLLKYDANNGSPGARIERESNQWLAAVAAKYIFRFHGQVRN